MSAAESPDATEHLQKFLREKGKANKPTDQASVKAKRQRVLGLFEIHPFAAFY